MKQKKQLSLLRIESFISDHPILLIFQFNNLSVTDWCILRTKLQEIEEINFLVIKNRFAEKTLSRALSFTDQRRQKTAKLQAIPQFHEKTWIPSPLQAVVFQGPNFLIGCKELTQVKKVWPLLSVTEKIFCTGGVYKGKTYTHLDFINLVQLDSSVYNKFFHTIDLKAKIYTILCSGLNANIYTQVQLKLIYYLNNYNNKTV
jgi:ribosomal protein L10